MFRKSLLAATLLAGTSLGALAGTVTPLTNGVPVDGVVFGFQLTDGSILFQGGNLQDFYRFRPDSKGSYANGTYSLAASLPADYVPYATSGGVLPDGARAFDWRGVSVDGAANRCVQDPQFRVHQQDGNLRSERGYLDDDRAAFQYRW